MKRAGRPCPASGLPAAQRWAARHAAGLAPDAAGPRRARL